jgi:hypothetical protein
VILTVLIVNAIYFTISTSIFRFSKEKIMARPVYITEKLVFDTADKLLADGVPFIEISTIRVRAEVKQGSPNDIQPHLQEWKRQQVVAKGLHVDIPDEFKEELSKFGSTLWKLAASITAEKSSQQYEDYHRVKAELTESYDLTQGIDDELTVFKDSLGGLCNELSLLKERVAVSKKGLEMLRSNSDDYMNTAETEMDNIKSEIERIIDAYTSKSITPKPVVIAEELPVS